jgi:hypothetical protein
MFGGGRATQDQVPQKIMAGSATPISENAVRREISPDWIPSIMSNLLWNCSCPKR